MPDHTPLPRDAVPSASLDELYWHTDLSTTAIAEQLGLPPTGLHRRVAPLGAGVDCYWCGTELTYTSRTSRTDPRLRCAACGSSRRNPLHRDAVARWTPAVVGGLIVVRERTDIRSRYDHWDPGWEIESCIDALARAGVAWDPSGLIVLPAVLGDGADLVELLAEREPGVVAVTDLRQLGASQSERLQALFALTRLRWRVLTARSIRGECSDEIRARTLDRLDDPYDERDRWSPSWSDHLLTATCSDEVWR